MGVKRLSFGGKLIVVSALIAVASLFMGWVDISLAFWRVGSITGFAIGAAVILLLWAYPLDVVMNCKRIGSKVLAAIAVLAVVIPAAIYIYIDQQGGLILRIDSGFGVMTFFLACTLMVVGIILDQLKHAFGARQQPISRSAIQNVRFSRCCWISADDLSRHVRVQVFHATGNAYFSLEPEIVLLENNGLHPWALGEAHVLLQHYEEQIRDIWRRRSKTIATVDPENNEGALYRAGKMIGTLFVGLRDHIRRS
jgi:hypothetical protein